ncbi:MAG: MarR family EPS-associated transcriptional regulator [Candidatus Omnitrophica bacterium]|nr:MarR family EPS-associated transcriptional regulator [Candidatus Omnitrophota bacterium]
MLEQPPKEEILHIIRAIENDPAATQRGISQTLDISLGKTNYLLKALINKGIIKAKSFSNNPGKLTKIGYILTSKGIKHRFDLMRHFLEKKESEYNQIKQEWEKLKIKHSNGTKT